MLRFFVGVLAIDQRASLAVDAAGRLTENLRSVPDAPWCRDFTVDAFQKQGCGLCAMSCNRGAPQLSTAHASDNSQVIQETALSPCRAQCIAANPPCTAISYDRSNPQSPTCTLHFSMPVGALCQTDEGLQCGANPNNVNDPVASSMVNQCGDKACFINNNNNAFKNAASMQLLGHGACHRGEAVGDSDLIAGMTYLGETIIDGMAYMDGLTPLSADWPPPAQLETCMDICKDDMLCRSVIFGKRFKKCTGTCAFAEMPGEYYCQSYGNVAKRVSLDNNDWRAAGCHLYGTPGALQTTIDINDKSDCIAPYGPMCYVKTTRSASDYIERGYGLCQMDNGQQAIQLQEATPSSTEPAIDMTRCQAECNGDPLCIGATHGMCTGPACGQGVEGSTKVQSFCITYQDCNANTTSAACPTGGAGGRITSSTAEMLGDYNHFCAAECSPDSACTGTACEPEKCSCLNKGPNGEGYQGESEVPGQANWKDATADKYACCGKAPSDGSTQWTGDRPACTQCLQAYSSYCMAKSLV